MTVVSRSAVAALLSVMLPAAASVAPQAAWAAAAAPATSAAVTAHNAALNTPAGKFIQSLGDRAIGVIADGKNTPQQRTDRFRDILTDTFDLPTIGRFVIGRYWNTATPEQQKEYLRLFGDLVIKTYGDRLTLYTGEGFVVTGARPESEKDTIVTSQITHPDGSQPTSIDWRVRQKDGKLGVIDVMVEGVSLSVTQRQEYAAVVQNNGGQIEGLLSLMRHQLQANQAASAGKPG